MILSVPLQHPEIQTLGRLYVFFRPGRAFFVYLSASVRRLGQGSGDENAFPEYAHRVFTTLPSGYRISKELPAKSTVTWVPSENAVRCRFLSPVRKA